MTDSNHPSYIYRSGGFLERPPFEQQDTDMYAFFVKGEIDKIQTLVNNELNAVASNQGKYNFKVLSEYVMLSFANIEHCYSTFPEDYQKGYGVEIDVCFWIPVGNVIMKDGKEYLDEVFWYTPYIWVNSPIAMIAGRNIYGYPKTIGEFVIPEPSSPDFFSAKVDSFKTFSPETQSAYNQVLTVTNKTPGESPVEKWDDFVDAMKGIFEIAKDSLLYKPDWNATEQMIDLLLHPQIPQLFLKQFPDVNGDKAVYQSLVTAPAKVNNFSKGGLLLGEYELNLESVASIPLVDTLGLSLGTQDIEFGFWLNFGFSVSDGKVIADNTLIPPKEKIAILGGGVASCAAAIALTDQSGWQDRYDITLYQQGWRIGGKGASGRNANMGERIEEHGLHVWLGFYRNAFTMIQEAYKELDRPDGAPLQTWEDAFKSQEFIVLMEHINEQWLPWCIDFPVKEGNPAEGKEAVSIWQLTTTIYAWIRGWLGDLKSETKKLNDHHPSGPRHTPEGFSGRITALADWISDEIEDTVEDIHRVASGLASFVESLPEQMGEHKAHNHSFLKGILEEIKEWLDEEVADLLEDNTELRRLYICIDLALAVLVGMIRDDVFEDGFNKINHVEFSDWLTENGANPHITVNSAPIRALYDLIFAYKDGDITQANVEAGTCLRGMLRLGLCYKGGIMWKMQAGMGDTIFTPFYQVLKNRGVKFKFFHEVDEITLDSNNKQSVDSIRFTKQVDLIDGPGSYHPLVNVKGLGCWPSAPLYDQLVPEQAQLMQDNHIDLEDFWSDWPSVYQQHFGKALPTVILERGVDFDTVISGISIGSLPYICPQLLDESAKLKACHDNVKTVVTQAYQLWTLPNLEQLGWTHYSETGQQPIMTSWTEPVDTWAAMNQLLDKEDWGHGMPEPHNCAYYCGVQPMSVFPPRSQHSFPAECKAIVKQNCINQLNDSFYSLWPAAATKGSFDWQVLMDPENRSGEARFNAQYWRSNISPSERYVQSVVGSSQYRIETKIADFNNIYFTGDWIKTGINAGCVEAAVMAGLQTSRAICGFPKTIRGEHDFGDPDLD